MIRKRATVASALALLLATATLVAEERRAFVPANDDVRSIEIGAEPVTYELPSSNGSSSLNVSATCSRQRPAHSDIQLSWDLPTASAGQVRIDITGFSDGFARGRYLTSGPRPVARRSLTFSDGEAGVYYYWRLMTRTSEGWRVRAHGRFEAPTCPHDSFEESER